MRLNDEEELYTRENYKSNVHVADKLEYMPKIYKINFWHEFSSNATLYNPYFEVLEKAREQDDIVFYFNSGGGSVSTLNLFINAMRRCKSKRIVAVVNYAASAAALLALFCDEIILNTDSTLMLHDFSTFVFGKSQEVEADFQHSKESIHKLMKFICRKVLSEEEIEQMFNGKDFYFNEKEVMERLKKFAKKVLQQEKEKNKKDKNKKNGKKK